MLYIISCGPNYEKCLIYKFGRFLAYLKSNDCVGKFNQFSEMSVFYSSICQFLNLKEFTMFKEMNGLEYSKCGLEEKVS